MRSTDAPAAYATKKDSGTSIMPSQKATNSAPAGNSHTSVIFSTSTISRYSTSSPSPASINQPPHLHDDAVPQHHVSHDRGHRRGHIADDAAVVIGDGGSPIGSLRPPAHEIGEGAISHEDPVLAHSALYLRDLHPH